jgi:hypothetical protein
MSEKKSVLDKVIIVLIILFILYYGPSQCIGTVGEDAIVEPLWR